METIQPYFNQIKEYDIDLNECIFDSKYLKFRFNSNNALNSNLVGKVTLQNFLNNSIEKAM